MFKATPTAPATTAVLILAALAASSAMGQFYSMGTGTSGEGISNDGRTVTGRVVTNGVGNVFTWTVEGGRREAPRGQSVFVQGISGDGRYVLASINSFTSPPFRWSEAGGFQDLGDSGWYRTQAMDINGDGSVIIGELHDQAGFFYQPFRWTAAGGYEILRTSGGDLINATFEAVSDDGTTAVGTSLNVDRGFVWTPQNGYRYLESLPGTDGSSRARGVSGNGLYVVGDAGIEGVGALWSPEGLFNLGRIQRSRTFLASEVSDDGRVVVGTSNMIAGGQFATVWTQGSGLQLLSDYLAANGIALPMNTVLNTCTGLSADGLTFTGTASINNQVGTSFGYVVTIPAPASACTLLGLLVCGRRRRGGPAEMGA